MNRFIFFNVFSFHFQGAKILNLSETTESVNFRIHSTLFFFAKLLKHSDVYQRPLSGTIHVVLNSRQHKHIVIYIVHYAILLGWNLHLQMAMLLDTCRNHFETDGPERCGTARTPSLHVALLLRGSRSLRRQAADVRH